MKKQTPMPELRTYADSGKIVKRFTYLRNGQLVAAKPDTGERLQIVEDYLGDRSMIWIACIKIETGEEMWRHSINDIVRITFDN